MRNGLESIRRYFGIAEIEQLPEAKQKPKKSIGDMSQIRSMK